MEAFLKNILNSVGGTAEGIERIKLGRGVVGKTTLVCLGLMVVLGIVAYRLEGNWFLISVALLAGFLFILYLFKVFSFATTNPGEALLEGAELITWKRIDLAAKGIEKLPESTLMPDPVMPGITQNPDSPDEAV